MSEYRTYKELNVWLKSRDLIKAVYLVTTDFPKQEMYGLVSQMRRCAVSIASNIAEGYGRQYRKETIQFLHIARGSMYELETQLYIAFDLGFYLEEKLNSLILLLEECRKLLSGLINYFVDNTKLK